MGCVSLCANNTNLYIFPASCILIPFPQDPAVVVDEILEAITDARPGMWYFPGLQAQVLR